jgi:hypothetical protein
MTLADRIVILNKGKVEHRARKAEPARSHECDRRRAAAGTRRLCRESQWRPFRSRHRAVGQRQRVLRGLRSEVLCRRQRLGKRNSGNALGSDEGLRLHDAQHRALHEPMAIVSACHLQGPWICRRRWLRRRALLRHRGHGRGCSDRLHAGARLGMSHDGDVGLSPRPRARQTHALYRRQDRRARSGKARSRLQMRARPLRSTRKWKRSPNAWRRCRSTNS